MWVTIDEKMAQITGAEVGATYKKYVEGIALGRAQTPEDVAVLASFLAGPDSRLHHRPGADHRRRTRVSVIPETPRRR
jgi:hypothetical protein